MPTIRIMRWQGRHEVSQSRKVRGALEWVAVPTKQGRGYCRLVAKHGALGLGVWVALLELAATRRRDDRGTICGTPEDVALMARLDPDEVETVLPTLIAIGWVEVDENGPEKAETSLAPSVLPERYHDATTTVHTQDGTGQDRTSPPTPPPTKRRRSRARPQDAYGIIPNDAPALTLAELAAKAGMTLDQYREYHGIKSA